MRAATLPLCLDTELAIALNAGVCTQIPASILVWIVNKRGIEPFWVGGGIDPLKTVDVTACICDVREAMDQGLLSGGSVAD